MLYEVITVLDSQGAVRCQLPKFEEALEIVQVVDGEPQPGVFVPDQENEAEIYRALVLGVRDYLGKNGFPRITSYNVCYTKLLR